MSNTPKIKKLKLCKLARHAEYLDTISTDTRILHPCVNVRVGTVSLSLQVVEFADAKNPEQSFQISLPGQILFVKGDVPDVYDEDILEIAQAVNGAVFNANASIWQLSLKDAALFAKKIKKAYAHIQ